MNLYLPLMIAADQVFQYVSSSRFSTISFRGDFLPQERVGQTLYESTFDGTWDSNPATVRRVVNQSEIKILWEI